MEWNATQLGMQKKTNKRQSHELISVSTPQEPVTHSNLSVDWGTEPIIACFGFSWAAVWLNQQKNTEKKMLSVDAFNSEVGALGYTSESPVELLIIIPA